MSSIDETRDLLQYIKSEIAELNANIEKIKEYSSSDSLIPSLLCQSTSDILLRISSYEENLVAQTNEIAEAETTIEKFADVEQILVDAEEKLRIQVILNQLSCVKSRSGKANALLTNLAECIKEADYNQIEFINIALALIDDVKNDTMPFESILLNLEGIEESVFFKLVFYYSKKDLIYDASEEMNFDQVAVGGFPADYEKSESESEVAPFPEEPVLEETVEEEFYEEPEEEFSEELTEEYQEEEQDLFDEPEIETAENEDADEEITDGFFEEEIAEPYIYEEEFQNEEPEEEQEQIEEEPEPEPEEIVEEEIIIPEEDIIEDFTFEYIESRVADMIIENKEYAALTLLKAAYQKMGNEIEELYEAATYAYDSPLERLFYDSDKIINIVGCTKSEYERFFIASATLRNFFYNDSRYDYDVDALNSCINMPEIPEIKMISEKFGSFKKEWHRGADIYSEYHLQEQRYIEKEIKNVVQKATDYYESYVETPFTDNSGIEQYIETAKNIFDPDGNLATALKIAADDAKEDIDIAVLYISAFMTDSEEYENEGSILTHIVEKMLDETWEKCCNGELVFLNSTKRNKLLNRIIRSLTIIGEYVRLNTLTPIENNPFKAEKNNVLRLINSAIPKCTSLSENENKIIKAGYLSVKNTLEDLKARIDGTCDLQQQRKFYFVEFLKTGLITLEDDTRGYYLPVLTDFCPDSKKLSLMARVSTHARIVDDYSFEPDYNEFENYNIESTKILKEYYQSLEKDTSIFENAEQYFKKHHNEIIEQFYVLHKQFHEDLELAQSYGKLGIESKEKVLIEANNIHKYSEESQNFGFSLNMQNRIKALIDKEALNVGENLQLRIGQLIAMISSEGDEKYKSSELFDTYISKIDYFLEKKNYTAAEDLINRISNEDIEEHHPAVSTSPLFDFHNQYDEIYQHCNEPMEILSKQAGEFVYNSNISNKEVRGAINLVDYWIKSNYDTNKISRLLSALGLKCSVEKVADNSLRDYYDCLIDEEKTGYTAYQHIIAPFGSNATKHSFRVKCLFGGYDLERLIAELDELNRFDKATIVFVDSAFTLADRRKIASTIKKRNYGEIYLIVDRVTITYLAAHYNSSNILRTLMNISMPYTYYQPYVYVSSNPMPPEMFIGRADELNKIKDPRGIHLLYGGRQLGKSALLKKAQKDIDGINNQRAVYVEIKKKGVEESAKWVARELIIKGILNEEDACNDWETLSFAIKNNIREKNINYLLLLLDEGDRFIEDCSNYGYSPIDNLKNIMNDSDINFKFVIAGLHNIVRYDKKSAISDNSGIPQLEHLTIKPFKFTDAKRLLEYPLNSLGMFFADNDRSDGLISTILATTNYFPILIQFYCTQLVESMKKSDFDAVYPETECPPYIITETHIQKLLANKDFDEKIREIFNITLALDEDNYYEIIALLMAEWCYEDNNTLGLTAEDILKRGKNYEIMKIYSLSTDRIKMYMDELVDLNIFRKVQDDKYVFSRQNFIQLMGSESEVYQRIKEFTFDPKKEQK